MGVGPARYASLGSDRRIGTCRVRHEALPAEPEGPPSPRGEGGATGLPGSPGTLPILGIELRADLRGRVVLLRLLGLVVLEPALQESDGGAEVIVQRQEQVDVVEVLLAAEAVGQVVAWVDGGPHFAAARAEEAEVAFADLGRRSRTPESGNGDRHRQVVAQAT